MTYNEFMNMFEEYKRFIVKAEVAKYGSGKEMAKQTGISPSTISRLLNNQYSRTKESNDMVSRIVGKDIKDVDIKNIKQLKIQYLKEQIEELKADDCRIKGNELRASYGEKLLQNF